MNANEVLAEIGDEIKKKGLPPLIERTFTDVHYEGAGKTAGDGTFRIMQWNLLAQALSQGSDNFILCPKEALDWGNRRLRIIEELLRYEPGILCLEEVDQYSYIKDILTKVGYEGIFFPKPDSPCLYAENSNGPDGCALFYKTSGFVLTDSKCVILQDNEGFDTNQVAVIAKLKIRTESKNAKKNEFYVVGTHLKAKAGYDAVRFEQGQYLVNYLSKLVGDTPVLICGDFNADPNEKVYGVFFDAELNLESAYTNLSDPKQEPPYTSWKIRGTFGGNNESCKTIDYMWLSRDKLLVRRILKLPTGEAIGENRLPSLTYPSDHLSLVCDISLNS
ncbi:hypothetical protein ScPMuIL_011401 [Solemya velum]